MLYWKWEKSIPEEVCELLLNQIHEQYEMNTGLVKIDDGLSKKQNLRNNQICFLDKNHWFEGVLMNHIRYANILAGWNYDINDCESIQYTHYEKEQKYDWHVDCDIYNTEEILIPYRKLTAVCQLNKSLEFTGGGTFIKGLDDSVLNEQGDIVVFPSFLEHKAETVLSGKRITMVCWANGPYFR